MLDEIVKENEDLLQKIKKELNMKKENRLALYSVNLMKLSDKTFDKIIETTKKYLKIPFKVYSEYAFDKECEKEATINFLYYVGLQRKYKILAIDISDGEKVTQDDNEVYDLIYSYNSIITSSVSNDYDIHKVPKELTRDEIALILDDGNLCFGYSSFGSRYTVYED